ncbi:MAG: hypothetical protein U1F98_14060 [Verrucomicrobiota bacterium]
MANRSCRPATRLTLQILAALCAGEIQLLADAATAPRVADFAGNTVAVISPGGQTNRLNYGEQTGPWTLMAVIGKEPARLAVFEDFSQTNGHLLFVGAGGVKLDLSKTAEPTWADPAGLYRGHTLEDVFKSEHDLLGDEILARPGDPDYAEVAACVPPISKTFTETFVGTPECQEKVGVFYGGATPNLDPAAFHPAIRKVRDAGRVLEGLLGGWLPVLRFVYPESPGTWSEWTVYAPLRMENGNSHVQPVWYRLCRIEDNRLRSVRYLDSYLPFPPRLDQAAEPFYADLLSLHTGYSRALAEGMQIDIPDRRLADLARHSLVREMMTRIGPFPKYGVFDRSYGGSEHEGFPDIFTVDTAAMIEWGMFDRARQYIENYFTYYVRDDGSILYRGPETGQYGRMLTVVAEYFNDTGDAALLLKLQPRIEGVVNLLLSMRAKALALPPENPAHGMIAGWSEADACFDPDPPRYMQPYFSNSSEAARGFDELGAAWERIGTRENRPDLARRGAQLRQESRELNRDLQTAIARSLLTNTTPPCLPSIAGATEPFHIAVDRDKLDPLWRSYRAYMEMLYSGNLTRAEVETIVRYRAAHHDILLGIPTVYGHNTHEWGGFLSYGHGYGLIQHDFTREYLLLLYSLMAHQYTRGTWTAPETRLLDPKLYTAPYCAPAQMTVPLLTRWMLVFEEPGTNGIWIAKATPRAWLEDGKSISVTNAPTRWGPVSFHIQSRLHSNFVTARLDCPKAPPEARFLLRLRAPEGRRIRSVVDSTGAALEFNADEETVTVPPGGRKQVELSAEY